MHSTRRTLLSRVFTRASGAGIVLVFCVLLLGACAGEETVLLSDIEYAGWRRTTPELLDQPVPGHGPGIRQIFANDVAFGATPDASGAIVYPPGSVFVKEIYPPNADTATTSPMDLTVMIKDPEHPENNGGWVWIKRSVESGAETVFAGDFCVTCHVSASEAHPYGTGNLGDDERDHIFHAPAFEAVQ